MFLLLGAGAAGARAPAGEEARLLLPGRGVHRPRVPLPLLRLCPDAALRRVPALAAPDPPARPGVAAVGRPGHRRRGDALRVRRTSGLLRAAAGGDRLPRGVRDPRRSCAHLREEVHLLLRHDADRPRALLRGAAPRLLPGETRMAEAGVLPGPVAARPPGLHRGGGGHHAHARRLQHDADGDAAAGALLRILPRRPRGRRRGGRPPNRRPRNREEPQVRNGA